MVLKAIKIVNQNQFKSIKMEIGDELCLLCEDGEPLMLEDGQLLLLEG